MCLHTNQIGAKTPYSKQGKLDALIFQTGLFGFVDSDGSQGRRRHSTIKLVLLPSDVWTKDRQESLQLWRLWRRLRDVIEEKRKNRKLGQKYEK
jgi:hypothetical protein